MILLDTDHLTILCYPGGAHYGKLVIRMQGESRQVFGSTIICVEEIVRGWLAEINRLRDLHDQVFPYERFQGLFEFFKDWTVLPFDEVAATHASSSENKGFVSARRT